MRNSKIGGKGGTLWDAEAVAQADCMGRVLWKGRSSSESGPQGLGGGGGWATQREGRPRFSFGRISGPAGLFAVAGGTAFFAWSRR